MEKYKDGKHLDLFSDINANLRNSFNHSKIDFNSKITYYDNKGNMKTLEPVKMLSLFKKIAALYGTLFAYKLKVFSPENKTYSSSDVELDFSLNGSASQISYSLDGQKNVTIAGTSTLTGLLSGEHSLTVYATDEAGNIGVSETIYFTIEPFPTTLVIASAVILCIVAVVILAYYKKYKRSA